jgi:hypothetical protein
MTSDALDDLILRHLDGSTSADEVARVSEMLNQDADFRSRFLDLANLIIEVQETLSLHGSPPAMLAIPIPKPVRVDEELSGTIELRRIYANAVLGGFGGLFGWLMISLLSAIVPMDRLNVYLRDAFIGPLVGVCIGFAVGASEGLLAARSLRRMLRGGGYGAALGAAGGVFGLLIGEFFFNLFHGGALPRALGWGLFGMFVGISDGVAQHMPAKVRYGLLGGLLGGLIGGSTYECLTAMFRGSGAFAWGSAIGLILLGACIGFLVSLVEALLRKSWLFFLTGRLEGQTRTLDSSRAHTLGTAASCTIVLPANASVAAVHAEIFFDDGEFRIRPRDGKVIVRREGYDQAVEAAVVLAPGDRVLLGETRMIFRNVEGKKR